MLMGEVKKITYAPTLVLIITFPTSISNISRGEIPSEQGSGERIRIVGYCGNEIPQVL